MLLSEPNTKLALDKAESMLRELLTPNAALTGGEAVRVEGTVGRSRYAEESRAAAARIILHDHRLAP